MKKALLTILLFVSTSQAQILHHWISYADGKKFWGENDVIVHYITTTPDSSKVLYDSDSDSVVMNRYLTKYHHVRIQTTALTAGNIYDYKIINTGVDTVTGTFYDTHTPYSDATFKFCVYGNSYGSAVNHSAVVDKIYAESPKFVVHLGNVTENGNVRADYHTYFLDVIDALTDYDIPFINIYGDNEYKNAAEDSVVRDFLRPAPYKYWSVDYETTDSMMTNTLWGYYPLNCMTIDTEKPFRRSTTWHQYGYLTAASAYTWDKYFVGFSHDSPYISGATSNTDFRSFVDSLMNAYDYKVLFSAGGNFYQRSEFNNRYYITVGTGGATLGTPTSDSSYVKKSYAVSYGYVVGYVNADSCHFKFKNISGAVVDSFTIFKTPYTFLPISTIATDARSERTVEFGTHNSTNGNIKYSTDPLLATYDELNTVSTQKHVFRLRNLTQDTKYYYQVSYTGYSDPTTYNFTTPADTGAYKILIMGDWGSGRFPSYNVGEWMCHYHLWDWRLLVDTTDVDLYLQTGEGVYYGNTVRSISAALPYFASKPIITNRSEIIDTTITMTSAKPYYSFVRWGRLGIFTLLQETDSARTVNMLDWFENILDTTTADILISNGHFQCYERDAFDVSVHATIQEWINKGYWDRFWALCDKYNVLGFYSHRAQLDTEAGRDGFTRFERLDRRVGRHYDISINNTWNSYLDPHPQGMIRLEIDRDNNVKIVRWHWTPLDWYPSQQIRDSLQIKNFYSKEFKKFK